MTEQTQTPKIKYALCIPAIQRYMPRQFWTPTLENRATCESDNTILQILPYITILDQNGNVFTYARGTAGDEKGLHNLRSCGVGGHIDTDVPAIEGLSALECLEKHIVEEAHREILEEVGYDAPIADLQKALHDSFLMYAPVTKVDEVHLAISMTIVVPDRRVLSRFEEGHLVDPRWLPREYLDHHLSLTSLIKPEALAWRFETWSENYLVITSSKERETDYRNRQDQSFASVAQMYAMIEALAKNEEAGKRLSMRIDVSPKMISLVCMYDGGLVASPIPRLANIQSLVLGEAVSAGEVVTSYTFFDALGRGIETVDFTHWRGVSKVQEEQSYSLS